MDLFSDDSNINDLGSALKLLKESKAGFVKLFNNSPVCMSMTTTTLGKRSYVHVNQKFLDTFGFSEADIIGRTSVEIGILDPEESLRVGSIIREKGRLQNDYVKCITKKGEIVHTISSIEFMEVNDETFLVSFFVDVTKMMAQQSLIERHAQQLEAVNRELEAFSYSVSHDLRAPLRAIDGYTKILEEDFASVFNDEGKKTLVAVQRNTQRMSNLIDDLLAFAMLGKKPLQKTSISMHDLVQEVLSELKRAAAHKAEITTGTLLSVNGDYALIKQVITNLVANAIKYSSRKAKPVIHIESQQEGGHVRYTVKDNGDGFDMKYADKLFGVFQRLHSAKEFEGTGVGLAIVQRIINKHGGTTSAIGEVGEGAAFSFSLPVDDASILL